MYVIPILLVSPILSLYFESVLEMKCGSVLNKVFIYWKWS